MPVGWQVLQRPSHRLPLYVDVCAVLEFEGGGGEGEHGGVGEAAAQGDHVLRGSGHDLKIGINIAFLLFS